MDFVKYIAVIFLIDPVINIKDVTLNNLSSQTVSKLLNILSKYKGIIKYVEIQPKAVKPKDFTKNIEGIQNRNNFETEMNDKRFKKPLVNNRIIVKRLIPHGLASSGLEYDRKFNSLYRPLVRVHKRKPLPKIKTILNFDRNKDDGIDKYGIDIHDYYDNDEDVIHFVNHTNLKNLKNELNVEENPHDDEELLQPFLMNALEQQKHAEETTTQLRLIRDIEKLLKNTHSRPMRFKTYDKVMKILENIENLRTHEKSDEVESQHLHHLDEYGEESTTKPKLWMPHYPPWNYWTYYKTIHQDVCPKGQVKINDRCIWIPPH